MIFPVPAMSQHGLHHARQRRSALRIDAGAGPFLTLARALESG
jgi:hypothetical protein